MRIGLFTDTYRPSINGIVFVVESLKRNLEALGHEVYVFCPAKSVRPSKHAEASNDDEGIIRFPSVKGAFFDDYDTSLFFPPTAVAKIRALELDVVHIFTPSQIGLLGIRAAVKDDIPFVVQHSTDLYEFVEHYPAVLPGVMALVSILLPSTVKLGGHDIKEIIKLYRPRTRVTKWNKEIIASALTILHSKADAVIALSRKSVEQLESWQENPNYRYDLTLMPNGVDPLPTPSEHDQQAFNQKYGIEAHDTVYGFVGRLGEEKNLDILIDAFSHIVAHVPTAKLLFVGDFEYREVLEERAESSGYGDRIIFTGALPRESLGAAYGAMDVFAFPSLKDTQGWVLHEAAHCGLPIVIIDTKVSEVVRDNENGFFAENTPESIAECITTLFNDPEMRARFGAKSRELAQGFSEIEQVKKLAELYRAIVIHHQNLLDD